MVKDSQSTCCRPAKPLISEINIVALIFYIIFGRNAEQTTNLFCSPSPLTFPKEQNYISQAIGHQNLF